MVSYQSLYVLFTSVPGSLARHPRIVCDPNYGKFKIKEIEIDSKGDRFIAKTFSNIKGFKRFYAKGAQERRAREIAEAKKRQSNNNV